MYAARAFQEQCILCKAHIRPNSIIFLELNGKCIGDTCSVWERIFCHRTRLKAFIFHYYYIKNTIVAYAPYISANQIIIPKKT